MLQANNIPSDISMLRSLKNKCTSLYVCQIQDKTLAELMLIKTTPSWVDACSVVAVSHFVDKTKQIRQLFFVDLSLKTQNGCVLFVDRSSNTQSVHLQCC